MSSGRVLRRQLGTGVGKIFGHPPVVCSQRDCLANDLTLASAVREIWALAQGVHAAGEPELRADASKSHPAPTDCGSLTTEAQAGASRPARLEWLGMPVAEIGRGAGGVYRAHAVHIWTVLGVLTGACLLVLRAALGGLGTARACLQ